MDSKITSLTLLLIGGLAQAQEAVPERRAVEARDTANQERETEERRLETLKSLREEVETAESRAEAAKKEARKIADSLAADSQFSEFGFGLGFGNVFLPGDGHIETAVAEEGIIRTTEQQKNRLGLWLTTSWVNDDRPSEFINFGPFLGVQLGGSDEIVDSIAVGVDFSFKRLPPELPLDFQFGWAWTKVNGFALGYANGGTLPTGSTQPLLKKTVEDGPVLIVSYNFSKGARSR